MLHMAAPRLWLLAALTVVTIADVGFLSPAPGAVGHGGSALTVAWAESGVAPLITDLTTYQLFLCAGGNDEPSMVELHQIVNRKKFTETGNSAEVVVHVAIGASSPKNAYFLKMISNAASGGTVINYSQRFSMNGMTGAFPPNVLSGLSDVQGVEGPPSENYAGAAGARHKAELYSTAFADQSGPLRYATMQRVPPTRITKKSMKPVNPTSPYTLATTFLPPVTSIHSTVTEPATWSYSQAEHTGTPAAMPDDNMQKFLNRWKD